MIIQLGTFENKSGVMRLSDPCYSVDTWCSKSMPCKTGQWSASVLKKSAGDWGTRVWELHAVADGFKPSIVWDDWGTLGVDSGQLGFFDEASYRDKFVATSDDINRASDEITWADDDPFFKVCCSLTLSKERAGVFSAGVVSSSGYGDGSYTLLTQSDSSGVMAAVKVIFIEDDEDGEEDSWEEFDELPGV